MDYGVFDLLTLLGSLGLFLYGMKVMSDSLMKLAGDQMRNILAKATSNRVFALMTGFFITAAIQSSSATTLMVVSFVNASLLTLSEGVGVIMGANIGTTVTAWLISILGFKVKMSALALPLVGVGFLFSVSKTEKTRQWGAFIVGFAVLFIGLQFLKDSVPDIRNNPQVLEFLAEYTARGYFSVLLFLLIGTILTLIVQSSSATMALTLLMTHEGWIPFDMAAAMVLGENIGTTVTANLAAIVGNYHAKRAARAHLIFNLLGVVWILVLFYPFLSAVGGVVEGIEGASPFASAAAIPIALSLFHTSFNILNAVVLVGFLSFIVRTVERLVPETVEKDLDIDEPEFLNESSAKYIDTGIKALTDESVRLLQNAAYKVLAHGLSVHRADLESDQNITIILDAPLTPTPIDIDRVYATQVKSIFGKILEYATRLQRRTNPDPQSIESIRNILFADRQLVQAVKRMKPLQVNLSHYMASPNDAIRKEYNFIRRRILKVVRAIKKIGGESNTEDLLHEIANERVKAENMDALLSGRAEALLYDGKITEEMASSLINDSASASRITKNLVDIAIILYSPRDTVVEEIDERSAKEIRA
jgi:phosphate:Na+ symporter